MAFVPPQAGYDRAITVFSPDGRLFQVQYAREAVKRGATAVGVKCKDGVVLAVEKRVTSKLIEPESYEKIFQIDEHIAAASSGIIADARVLVDRARLEAQIYRLTYGEPVPLTVLVKKICDLKQMHTQYGGVRPFGAALLMAGVNEKPELFETDPSGAYFEWKAVAIGSGRNTAMAIFEERYKDDMTLEDAIKLAVLALAKTMEEPSPESIEVAVITVKEKKFKKISKEEVAKCLEEALKEAEAEEVPEKEEDYSELDSNY
ncbi:proteasome endopeptidase complex, archaeal, alpha subunit [Thermococci archaeon]|uniref:Proteasome subunit alpha n=1 Tax=Thermococcus litoralis TaxID=2265 RepID=A0A7C0TYV1_THELI|nr:MAG: proteasome endopeptidase complex, archaeal, alpha subunit [Thermococci archaeon]RLF79614.1 MAG: proteasome endopeptidase complex, archaeal, alpha subunit [Thermococci archaeon]RLF88082.1 MAG: proteasome endopeptidase complex, archaeal, alpha subunit [Thermococci archaeon]HDD31138.1 archaeal proteasome endopeptidase complex subunit alpha [Thermococcus litoralis]